MGEVGQAEQAVAYCRSVVAMSQAQASNCEWMFDDCATGWLGIHALAHLNPLRWSGPTTFDAAIRDLEDVLKHHTCRPIRVKVPANSSNAKTFKTTDEAIAYLKEKASVGGRYE